MEAREKERLEGFLLCSMRGIGAASIRKLIREAGSCTDVFRLPDQRLKELLGEKRAEYMKAGLEEKQKKAAERRYFRMREKGILFLPCWDESYPSRLRQLPDPPVCLYVKGKLPEEEKKAVAVIGARECSGYGREAARYFAFGLAKEGAVIVSGMARGVDGIAQTAALEAGGMSVGVLGCGVDICYPPENAGLYERLAKEGCLLSEYPPGIEPKPQLFPPRNRIISGLSDMVLVTEAREKSGTLITVDMALEQGREVFAVPGRITDCCSRGCNRLIRNGAGMAVSVPQLWDELRGIPGGKAENERNKSREKEAGNALRENREEEAGNGQGKQENLPVPGRKAAKIPAEGTRQPLGKRILKILDCDPVSLDEIQRRLTLEDSGMCPPLPELMQELVLLCMEGKAGKRAGMYFAEKSQEEMNIPG